jgi:hypothetical protein
MCRHCFLLRHLRALGLYIFRVKAARSLASTSIWRIHPSAPQNMSRLFGNADDEMVGWMPDSGQRGTIDLLWTCIVTLFLCVWSALHLNIPTEKSWKARARRRMLWLLFALLAPELVRLEIQLKCPF